MAAPLWAVELTNQVCTDYHRKSPNLDWHQRRDRKYKRWQHGQTEDGGRYLQRVTIVQPAGQYTSGTTWPSGRVLVRAGTDAADAKLVLLHELAHHILNKTRSGRRQGHSIRFWRLAFQLYQRYGVDLDYAFSREKDYKVKATQAYQELMASLNN